ncbi:nitroreductase [Streptomyces angustmyceticus]|uniref:Putative NAD(P)H nitroreductase n=2 Tax=Streptomyces angustmyceticus TaxID=285578 RepID=A0A5J4LAS3_9ACTN|nr:nitroreductase [Streptomyces angustmyceticus]GES28406.1 nitroreductase [Streptomyces angustmyceticus]
MDVMTAILTRRSSHLLSDPGPTDAEFTYLLGGAATAPDHGALRPWRWVLLRGDGRAALGDCLAAEGPPDQRDRVRRKMLRSPLKAVLIFVPRPDHRVQEWEQLAGTSSMVYAMMMLLHARGYGSIWRTGALCRSTGVRELLGLSSAERVLGSLDIGTPDEKARRSRRPREDVAAKVSAFDAAAVTAARTGGPAGP